jgi:hypothetical protein
MFTAKQKNVVAAVFGHRNMGQKMPSIDTIQGLLPEGSDLSTAVMYVSGDLMESDEHQDIFEGEAAAWVKDPKLDSLDGIRSVRGWNDIADLIEKALQKETK